MGSIRARLLSRRVAVAWLTVVLAAIAAMTAVLEAEDSLASDHRPRPVARRSRSIRDFRSSARLREMLPSLYCSSTIALSASRIAVSTLPRSLSPRFVASLPTKFSVSRADLHHLVGLLIGAASRSRRWGLASRPGPAPATRQFRRRCPPGDAQRSRCSDRAVNASAIPAAVDLVNIIVRAWFHRALLVAPGCSATIDGFVRPSVVGHTLSAQAYGPHMARPYEKHIRIS